MDGKGSKLLAREPGRQKDRMDLCTSTGELTVGVSGGTIRHTCPFPKMDHLETSSSTFKPVPSHLGGWDGESELPRAGFTCVHIPPPIPRALVLSLYPGK